jgi:hypothetical protein
METSCERSVRTTSFVVVFGAESIRFDSFSLVLFLDVSRAIRYRQGHEVGSVFDSRFDPISND